MATLTKKQRKKYVEGGGVSCPFCGSTDISPVGSFDGDDGGELVQDIECNDCPEGWRDVYSLTGVEQV